MKLYRKRFLLIVALAFFTICAWTIFSRNVSEGLKYASPSPNGSSSSSNFHQAPALAAVTAAAIVAAKDDHAHHHQQQQLQKVRNIVCNINGEYKVNCLKLMVAANSVSATKPEGSVYVPFSLIHKYFEINGKVVNGPAKSGGTTSEYFEWSHSYSKIFYPDEPYSSRGRFLWFANYNVEVRERVKCVSAAEAVPVSTQWYAKGHFYPTQIAQYGLSHFSKNLTAEAAPQVFSLIEWPGGRLAGNVTSRPPLPAPAEGGADHLVISENTTLYLPESDHGQDMTSFLVLDLTLQLPQDNHCSISVVIADSGGDGKDGEEESLLVLQYSTAVTAHLRRGSPQYRMAVYGLAGSEEKSDSTKNVSAEWRPFTRDLLVDLYKGNLISSGRRSRPNRSLRVVRIELAGRMAIGRRAALLTSAHGHFALAAGDWLVRRQNAHGGWDIKVKRRLQSKSALGGGGGGNAPPPPPPPPLVLAEGWHSAMAQGQAMSLLARLYAHTGRPAYLAAAKRALAVFEVEAFRGGVRARFLDRHVWYEEYPTVPSIFVLNGFIYSLFGLYDLGQICGSGGGDQAVVKNEDDPACLKAASLFEEGVRSLEAMLPLFDSGSGSFYDLRHQALATVAPNVARWDYHSTHINQLLALQTVVRRDVFQATADRWIAYMRGHRAAHN